MADVVVPVSMDFFNDKQPDKTPSPLLEVSAQTATRSLGGREWILMAKEGLRARLFETPEAETDEENDEECTAMVECSANARPTGEKAFPCNVCHFSTNDASNLKVHMRTHTGEKPFKCKAASCAYATSHSSHLTRHMKTHTKLRSQHTFENVPKVANTMEKVFRCDWTGCPYTCARMSTMRSHQRVHTGETPYLCSWQDCQYSSKFLSNLRRHERGKHKRRSNDCEKLPQRMRVPPLITSAPAVPPAQHSRPNTPDFSMYSPRTHRASRLLCLLREHSASRVIGV